MCVRLSPLYEYTHAEEYASADDFPEDFKKRLASDPEFYEKFRHAVEHDLNVRLCSPLPYRRSWS